VPFATSGRAQLAYDDTGEGPEVLLIHAGVTDRRSWSALIAHLGPGYRCVAYDQRTYGETTYEPEDGWSLTDDALAVMDAAGMGTPVIVAASMGGLVALDLALAHPDRVAGLVLIGPAVRGAPTPEIEEDSPTAALFAEVAAAGERGDLAAMVELEARLFLDGPEAPAGRVSGPVRDLFLEMDLHSEQAEDPGEPRAEAPAWPRLKQITVPVLVLTGRLDVEHLQALNAALARHLPHGRHQWLEGVAHLPHLEGDRPTLAAVSLFVAKQSTAPSPPAPLQVIAPRHAPSQPSHPG
jgi:pimeloyl-ACP methyl ester carboxylesterase